MSRLYDMEWDYSALVLKAVSFPVLWLQENLFASRLSMGRINSGIMGKLSSCASLMDPQSGYQALQKF